MAVMQEYTVNDSVTEIVNEDQNTEEVGTIFHKTVEADVI